MSQGGPGFPFSTETMEGDKWLTKPKNLEQQRIEDKATGETILSQLN